MSKLLTIILICVLIGISIFFITNKNQKAITTSTLPPPTNNNSLKTYTNPSFNDSFEYPGDYILNDEYPNYLLLKKPSSPQYDWTYKIDTYQNNTGKNFQDFITNQLMLNCAANGPNASQSCDKVISEEPFITSSGINGLKIYLNLVIVKSGESTNWKIGPYYVFDISKQTENKAQAVNFYSADFIDLNNIDPAEAEVLKSIAKSFKFN